MVLCSYYSESMISLQLLFKSNCCVSRSWKLLLLSSPFERFLILVLLLLLDFLLSGTLFLRGLDGNRGDFWPSLVPFDFGFGLVLFRLFWIFAVNSNIIAFSATEAVGVELPYPPSNRNTFSDDEYRDNGVGVSSWFAGTAKFSRIRIDAKLTSWSAKMFEGKMNCHADTLKFVSKLVVGFKTSYRQWCRIIQCQELLNFHADLYHNL